ncbi:MAG: hypothetical protein PHQ96_02860 [Candidatus Omnitrophica bacterium]|nr:hypothetical protein [Candidatus Omnitrophota bacterium]
MAPARLIQWKALLISVCMVLAACAAYAHAPIEDKDFEQGIYSFLKHQRNNETGLFDSFYNSDDELLAQEALTYDQALTGLALLELKEYYQAKQILDFFKKRFDERGLCYSYDSSSGACLATSGAITQANMWVALLSLRFGAQTGDQSFYNLGREIGLWALRLEHYRGALSMGKTQDSLGSWNEYVSVEDNLVAYSVFRFLYENEADEKIKKAFAAELEGIRKFIRETALVKNKKGNITHINIGYNLNENIAPASCIATVSGMLLVFNPYELREFFGVSENMLLEYGRKEFFTSSSGIKGYDFTDAATCRRIGRRRVISLEETAKIAVALTALSRYYQRNLSLEAMRFDVIAHNFTRRQLVQNLDKKKIITSVMIFYPFATEDIAEIFPLGAWRLAPRGKPSRCGTVSSTIWRFFLYLEFNPLDIRASGEAN